ncbi:hypothetical protein ACF9IK_01570 [Kitasatospora hibisci]|uniref:hypothetical protein n=1 Tax=Kitasatospora hibisci TaxID=3369522 RepID=UPI0037541503
MTGLEVLQRRRIDPGDRADQVVQLDELLVAPPPALARPGLDQALAAQQPLTGDAPGRRRTNTSSAMAALTVLMSAMTSGVVQRLWLP